MTKKEELHNELRTKGIYYKTRINQYKDNVNNFIFFDRGFYIRSELVNNLILNTPIKTYGKYPGIFTKLVGLNSTTALHYTVFKSNKHIHLQKGFYNKEKLIEYLL